MNWRLGLLVFILFTIALMTLISLGVAGKEALYYHELNTQQQKDHYYENYGKYVSSLDSIMAWNVFLVIFMPILIASTYKCGKKCNIALLVFYFLLIWLPRWIASIVFLEGEPVFKKLQQEQAHKYGNEQECQRFIEGCAKARSYHAMIGEETAHAVIFFLLGLAIIPLLYQINSQCEPTNDNQAKKYQDNEGDAKEN